MKVEFYLFKIILESNRNLLNNLVVKVVKGQTIAMMV